MGTGPNGHFWFQQRSGSSPLFSTDVKVVLRIGNFVIGFFDKRLLTKLRGRRFSFVGTSASKIIITSLGHGIVSPVARKESMARDLSTPEDTNKQPALELKKGKDFTRFDLVRHEILLDSFQHGLYIGVVLHVFFSIRDNHVANGFRLLIHLRHSISIAGLRDPESLAVEHFVD